MVNHEPTLRVIRILDTISYYSELGLTLKDLIDKTKMPKSTVFNIVSTLVDQGVVEEVDEIRRGPLDRCVDSGAF